MRGGCRNLHVVGSLVSREPGSTNVLWCALSSLAETSPQDFPLENTLLS